MQCMDVTNEISRVIEVILLFHTVSDNDSNMTTVRRMD